MDNPRKRPRTESNAMGSHFNSGKRHPELWFDDGSIVLIAGDTMFRVHRSTLCTHSTVFEDMFKVAQPSGEGMIDGCPTVEVHDQASDMACLLKALYNPLCVSPSASLSRSEAHLFSLFATDPSGKLHITIKDLTTLLRTSHKYDIARIRIQSVQALQKHFPLTLAELDAAYDTSGDISQPGSVSLGALPSAPAPTQIIEVINTATKANALELLPTAYYILCHNQLSHYICSPRLSRVSLQLCMFGREELLKAQRKMGPWSCLWTRPRCDSCLSPTRCKSYMDAITTWFTDRGFDFRVSILDMPHLLTTHRVCKPCCAVITSNINQTRQEAWEKLPGWFGLGNWETLVKNTR